MTLNDADLTSYWTIIPGPSVSVGRMLTSFMEKNDSKGEGHPTELDGQRTKILRVLSRVSRMDTNRTFASFLDTEISGVILEA